MTFGTNKVIDVTNNVCFGLVIASFLGLVGSGAGAVQVQNLAYMDLSAVRAIVPTLLLALVFHNVVPSVAAKLRYDKKSICTAITLGSLLPLTMFVIWDAVVLGLIKDYDAVAHSTVLLDPLELLLSNQPTESRAFGEALVTLFTESALITSFIGFVVGRIDYAAT
jgi:tyrosine-specific transport protein